MLQISECTVIPSGKDLPDALDASKIYSLFIWPGKFAYLEALAFQVKTQIRSLIFSLIQCAQGRSLVLYVSIYIHTVTQLLCRMRVSDRIMEEILLVRYGKRNSSLVRNILESLSSLNTHCGSCMDRAANSKTHLANVTETKKQVLNDKFSFPFVNRSKRWVVGLLAPVVNPT